MKDEPAFPVKLKCYDGSGVHDHVLTGLTKREYFAGLALTGVLADRRAMCLPDDYAKDAVRIADALLAELEKGK